MNKDDLRQYSPITYVLERAFYFMQYASPANLLFKTRFEVQGNIEDYQEHKKLTKIRACQIEAYIVIWLLLELVLGIMAPKLKGSAMWLLLLPAFRIFDIFQSAINMTVFDRLRLGNKPHLTASLARTLILSLWNFIELILCFGILYSSSLATFNRIIESREAYYFSVVTQLTIGYGDIYPKEETQLLVAGQGIMGFVFGLIVLSRVVTLLPETQIVLGDE